MKFTVITVFPHLVESFFAEGLIAQARRTGQVDIQVLNPRAFTSDVHQTVDDRAFGGGDGMVMKIEPLAAAIDSLKAAGPVEVAVLTPQGAPWTQSRARAKASRGEHFVLVCGRYAGVDHRVHALYADEEISLGDFVLNGGEVAALAVIESVARLLPGVLGNARSPVRDSFGEDQLLECPQFTRPREFRGLAVPEVLLGGHHQKIADFERAVALVRTACLRPADFAKLELDLKQARKLVLGLTDAELLALGLERPRVEALS